ncbi:Tom6p ASCRUDRAFT_131967 [Ascoidea rubescens DSM 1968]|uniref:Uncharacterized protein n=1 Tax=Ascoidea rubescens DSM 1968 TaxID=1344418 RepID=A0A1D2V893_9ASCO|nr:hypothetical protein ASCRUDRAFT_131967 [Ascoidea rubescens DSM 1968]ODV57876.1 hypothetical protein ASCRUDRAFT_131967 [Ascoidea rubescens DSM 1968]
MNGVYGIPRATKQEPVSRFQKFKESPAYPVVLNVSLFAAGVWFIQSEIMDLMVPQ